MKRPDNYLNWQAQIGSFGASTRVLRFSVLLGILVAISQLIDQVGDASAEQVAVFWTFRVAGLAGCFLLSEIIAHRWFSGRFDSPAWLKPVVVITLLALIPMTVIELVLEWFVPQLPSFDDRNMPIVIAYLGEYATLVSVILPLNMLLWLLIDQHQSDGNSSAHENKDDTPAFLSKSSAKKATDVLALEADEHYVRVHTNDLSDLVYYRFSDAVEEMPDDLGTRVHRSWWVADNAVYDATRGTRRWSLTLCGGLQVPVSDSFVRTARNRGYLRRKRTGKSDSSPKKTS